MRNHWFSTMVRVLVMTGLPIILMSPLVVMAADNQGNYSVHGPGSFSCQKFTDDIKNDATATRRYGSWISGYLSSHNRRTEKTFDISPFIDSSSMVEILARVCRDNPNLRVETAVSSIVSAFSSSKIESRSQVVTLSVGDMSMNLRQSVLENVEKSLGEIGYGSVTADGTFDQSTKKALQDFQESRGLEKTGLPDTDTLIRLLLKEG